MIQDDPWGAVARECPCRILACLHRSGRYAHGTVPGRPGKVLCVHAGATIPPGWTPTPAQEAAERAERAASGQEGAKGTAARVAAVRAS